MMKIADLAHKEGKAGHWSSKDDHAGDMTWRTIRHYDTIMLDFNANRPDDLTALYYSIGNGSVSDQQGMNKLFRELNLDLYFSRKGGAKIS